MLRKPRRATIAPMFKYLLVLADGSPTEPAVVLVTAVPNWKVGEVCMVGSGDRFRILAIDMEVHEELEEQRINGMFVIEPA
jgi:hypothetical protein